MKKKTYDTSMMFFNKKSNRSLIIFKINNKTDRKTDFRYFLMRLRNLVALMIKFS